MPSLPAARRASRTARALLAGALLLGAGTLPVAASAAPAREAQPPAGLPGPSAHSSDGEPGTPAPPVPPAARGLRVMTAETVREVAPGITLRQWDQVDARGPVRAHLLTVDLDEPGVSLEYLSRPGVRGRAPVSRLVRRDAAVAGVNGDFFDISDTGAPIGVGVDRGHLRHAPLAGWNTSLVVGRDGTASIAEPALRAVARGRRRVPVTNLNSPFVRPHGVGLYTSEWGRTAGRRVVDGAPRRSLRQVVVRRGRVVANTRRLSAGRPVRGQVLVGRGAGAKALARLRKGSRVRLAWRLEGRPALAISGNALLLREGAVIATDDTVMHPRTAVGIDADTGDVLLLVVDGRQDFSRGLTMRELATMMHDLGAEDALNLDGGGSSTLVAADAEGTLVVANSPSDGQERLVPNGLGVVYRAP